MKHLLLLFLVGFIRVSMFGQITFEKSSQITGNQTASSIIPISDSTYFLTYHTDSLNSLYKLDRFGDTIWTRSYPFIRNGEKFLKIVKTKSDYLIYSHPSSLLKLNSIGDTIWYKYIGSNHNLYYFDLVEDKLGNIILIGNDFSSSSFNGVLTKLNSNGDEIIGINKVIPCPTTNGCIYNVISISRNGNYLIGGQSFDNFNYKSRILIVDSLGGLVVSKVYSRAQPFQALSEINSLIKEADGGLLFGGFDFYSGPFDSTYIVKTDSVGNFLWRRGYKGNNAKWQPSSILKIPSGYFVAGPDEGYALGSIQLMKLDNNYNFVWQKSLNMSRVSWLNGMALTADGGVVMTGILNRSITGKDVYYVKTDSNGFVTSLSPNLFHVSVNNFLVSPNPTEGVVNMPYVEGLKRVEVFDIGGKLLQSFVTLSSDSYRSRSVNKIDISNYKNGIYFLKLIMQNGEVFTNKVIKE